MTYRPLTALVAVAAFLAAGCSGPASQGGEDADDAGSIQQHVVDRGTSSGNDAGQGAGPGEPGSVAPSSEDVGSIDGRVTDDLNTSLAGASVSLLDTELFTVTDDLGRFAFVDLEPGAYRVQALLNPYRAHQGEVNVMAGKITEATITLVTQEDVGAGYRQHVHDFWKGATEVTLMDHDVDPRETATSFGGYPVVGPYYTGVLFTNQNTSMEFIVPTQRDDGRPPLVLPGTAELHITISWDDADVEVEKFGVGYATAATNKRVDRAPVANGVTTTIQVAPEQTDLGHQLFTLWRFHVYTGNHYNQGTGWHPSSMLGPIHVKMVIVRGTVTADAPHDNYWGDNTTYLVRNFTTVYSTTTIYLGQAQLPHMLLYADDGRLVPPGTQRLRMKMHYEHTDAPGTPLDSDWQMAWRPANLQAASTPKEGYLTAPSTQVNANTKAWDIQVDSSQTDAFYQRKSNWGFLLYLEESPDAGINLLETHHRFQLEVIAFKDPGYV